MMTILFTVSRVTFSSRFCTATIYYTNHLILGIIVVMMMMMMMMMIVISCFHGRIKTTTQFPLSIARTKNGGLGCRTL